MQYGSLTSNHAFILIHIIFIIIIHIHLCIYMQKHTDTHKYYITYTPTYILKHADVHIYIQLHACILI